MGFVDGKGHSGFTHPPFFAFSTFCLLYLSRNAHISKDLHDLALPLIHQINYIIPNLIHFVKNSMFFVVNN